MCGLVAAFTKLSNGFTKKTEDTFFDMLYADSLRGEDSTGIIAVHNDGAFGITKMAMSSVYCIPQMQTEKHIQQMFTRGRAYIGHNRKATIGKVNDNNAHPFVVNDTFAMVHNGTLFTHKNLADVEIDSEALTIHLSKYLTKDFNLAEFEEAMGEVRGAFAIIAYNQDTETVYFTRNNQRPLSIIHTEEGFLLSSEVGLGLWCANRNGLGGSQLKVENVEEHVLYSVDLDTLNITKQEYVPKKAMPVTPVTTITRGLTVGNTGEDKTFDLISKSQLKRLRRKWVGKYIGFFVDDWVEKAFPRTTADGETELLIFGESDDLSFNHTINGEFDVAGTKTEAWRITERAFRGQVVGIERQSNSTCLTVYLHDISMYNAPIIDGEYIKRKLDEKEKTNLH